MGQDGHDLPEALLDPRGEPHTAVRSMMPTATPRSMRKVLTFWLQRADAACRHSRHRRPRLGKEGRSLRMEKGAIEEKAELPPSM